MTVLLNAVGHRWLAHASDRRLTRLGKYVHDPAANKALLLVQPNIKLIISYTGLAYLGGTPTDSQIIGAVTQVKFSNDFAFGIPGDFGLGEATVWTVVQRIRGLIEEHIRELRGAQVPLIVRIIGFHRRRSVWLPFAARVLGGVEGVGIAFDEFPAKKNPALTTVFFEGSGAVQAKTRFDSSPFSDNLDKGEAAAEFAKIVGEVSASEPTVGPDSMTITLWAEEGELVGSIRFFSAAPANLGVTDPESGCLAAYTPWILVDNFVMQPTIVSGTGPTITAGRARIIIEMPDTSGDAQNGIVVAHRRQPRVDSKGALAGGLEY